ncbi:MAG: hypothetical protein HQL82_14290 [Magnetococcales bacterium]|nr:hypothetical protein [Magnetococcales bacterium]
MSQTIRHSTQTLDLLARSETYEGFKKVFARLTDEEIQTLSERVTRNLVSVAERRMLDMLLKDHQFLLSPRADLPQQRRAA